MKGTLILLGSGLLATTLAVAQDMPASSNTDASQSKQTSQSYQTSNGVIRGCLSGSAGNYTITDQNGMQYEVNGPDNQLQASVGHEVELTTRQDQASATSTQGDQTTSSTTNSVQVSNIRDVASTCTKGNSSSTSPTDNENGATPKGTPDAAEPPQPQTIAMLQQESKPDMGANPQQTTPPVTSQTPATPGQSTNSTQQPTPPASSTTSDQQSSTPSSTNGMTGSQVDQNAQGARQGEMNTNPNVGSASGANPSSTANSNAAPSNAQQQPNANDQNKPLYERQATDIPWANHSGQNSGNSGTTGTTSPPPPQQ